MIFKLRHSSFCMDYKIIWDDKVREFMRKMEKEFSNRIFKKVDSIKHEPHRFLEGVEGHHKLQKLRVGDYRVIVEVGDETREIRVRLVDHRSRVYKILNRSM